jgi:phage FluMu gp28-like protein
MDGNRRSYFGQDFGRSGDLSVIIPLQETQGALFKAPFTVELRNVPFKQQEQILFYVIDRLPRFTHGALDARGNGQYLAEVAAQQYGSSRISEVMLTEPWYREQMPRYKAAFEDRSIILPRDADIIEDHRAFKMIRGVARLPETKNTGSDRQKRHGDSGIAGVLAWFAANNEEVVEYAYHPVTKRDMADGRPIATTAGFGRNEGAW